MILLLGVYFYSTFAMAEGNQTSVVDLEFIEQLGSSDEDQDALLAAMQAYNKSANGKNKSANTATQVSTDKKSNIPQSPTSKKAGSLQ